jgi:hypothetical protein
MSVLDSPASNVMSDTEKNMTYPDWRQTGSNNNNNNKKQLLQTQGRFKTFLNMMKNKCGWQTYA